MRGEYASGGFSQKMASEPLSPKLQAQLLFYNALQGAKNGHEMDGSGFVPELESTGQQLISLHPLIFNEDGLRHAVRSGRAIQPYIRRARITELGSAGSSGMVAGSMDSQRVERISVAIIQNAATGNRKDVDFIEGVHNHEQYHDANGHAKKKKWILGETAEGQYIVRSGGIKFTHEALVEGVTVYRTETGNESAEYQKYKQMIEQALANSGLTINQLEDAIAKGDLRLIEDVDWQDSLEFGNEADSPL